MANPAAAPAGENPYGLLAALEQGGVIAYAVFIILVVMSAASWYILFVKLFEQQKIINQGKRARTTFWQAANLREMRRDHDHASAVPPRLVEAQARATAACEMTWRRARASASNSHC